MQMIRHDHEFVQQILPLIAVVEEHLQQKRDLKLVKENRTTLPRDRGYKESALIVHSSNPTVVACDGNVTFITQSGGTSQNESACRRRRHKCAKATSSAPGEQRFERLKSGDGVGSCRCKHHRGRAALQRRVSRFSIWALAPVDVVAVNDDHQ